MGLISTIKETLEASTASTTRRSDTGESSGAYWCHDCEERIPGTEAETSPPTCPDCGAEMTLERSPGSAGCAC